MKQIRPYQLTSWTEEHLIALAQVFNKGHNVNFAFFQAFNNLMKNMELGKFTKKLLHAILQSQFQTKAINFYSPSYLSIIIWWL